MNNIQNLYNAIDNLLDTIKDIKDEINYAEKNNEDTEELTALLQKTEAHVRGLMNDPNY